MEKDRLIEVFLALILIFLIFILVFVGLSVDKLKTISSVISNSYNIVENSYNTLNNLQKTPYENKETIRIAEKPVQKTTYVKKSTQKTYYYLKDSNKKQDYYIKTPIKTYKKYYYYNDYEPKKNYVWDWGEWDEKSYSKHYDSFGKHSLDKSWEFYTDTYRVYVYNGGPGDYFKVKFYFEDCGGHEKNYEIRKYIGYKDEEIFYFRDINSESDKYCNWKYVVSH